MRVGSLERDEPTRRSIETLECRGWDVHAQSSQEAHEGRPRESGAVTVGENALERMKPKRGSAALQP